MNIIDIQESKNNMVKKHNELIKAKGELSNTAQKMLAMLVSMIREDDTEFQKYALHIETYLEHIGSSSNNKKFIKQQAKELMSNPFIIDGKMFNWCSMVDFESLKGYVVFQIHSDLKPYLLQFKKEIGNFTAYFLVNILNLKGKYIPRLYEIFISKWKQHKYYNKSSKSHTFEIKVSELKELLGLSKKKYLYGDMKKKVLNKAKEEFKQHTDIWFKFEEKKIGNRVDSLKITLYENNKGSNNYLRSRKAFITYLREKFKPDPNKGIYPAILETDIGTFKISSKGHLYISKNGKAEDLDEKQADEFWTMLYERAKEDNFLEEDEKTEDNQEEQNNQEEQEEILLKINDKILKVLKIYTDPKTGLYKINVENIETKKIGDITTKIDSMDELIKEVIDKYRYQKSFEITL